MALAPTPPSQQRPTMRHSSAFLLPPPSPSSSPAPGGGPADDATVALVVLNQPLPRFAPLLWSRGNRPAPTHPGPCAPFEILLVAVIARAGVADSD
ncbi:thiamine pyrophosphokinase 1 [Panicum miliaceum]|uniref:Thiamine pyrophosphokinase 1 n=1 Tax=Panicum miliaceum TaxID=4540 RepID=A0A3L6SX73_PANMI|nr:thiamine pyrophosphokinase 1 [Panicum miliaceum]